MAIHTRNDSFVATPTAARRTILHISSCRALVGGTYGGLCGKDYSQWIEVIQARACGTAGYEFSWQERDCMHEFPLSNSGESNAMLENVNLSQ